jgi:hypothetical protein
VEVRVKALPCSVWLKTLKRDLMENYGVKLTPNKLKVLCEVDWPVLGVGWPPEGLLDKTVVNEVYRVIVGNPRHPEKFPCVGWQDAVLSQATWLRSYQARVATTSKCREKAKEPILAEEPEETPLLYVPLYPPLPPVPSSAPPPPHL